MSVKYMYVNTSKPFNLLRSCCPDLVYDHLDVVVMRDNRKAEDSCPNTETDLHERCDPGIGVVPRSLPDNSKTITIPMQVSERPDDTLPSPITPYDACVMDAVYSLFRTGHRDFTLEMILNIIDGYSGVNVSRRQLHNIAASIDRMSEIQIKLDCYNEFSVRGIKGRNKFDSTLLKVNKHKPQAGDPDIVRAYTLLEKPVMYAYAEKVKQIGSYPVSFLADNPLAITIGTEKPRANQKNEVRTRRSLVDEDVTLKHCIMRRILAMRNKKNYYNTIKIAYDYWKGRQHKGLFAEIGVDLNHYQNPRKKRAQLHHKVATFLDSLTAQGFIAGYGPYWHKSTTPQKEPIAGVKIFLNEEED